MDVSAAAGAGAGRPATAGPASGVTPAGYPTPVRLDSEERVLWWMPGDPDDVVAVTDGVVMTWPSAEEALQGAAELGWRSAVAADELPVPVDGDHVAGWVRGVVLRLDPRRALEVWNLADDVAGSLSENRPGRGGEVVNGCHTKLTAAAVPWAFDRDSYEPRWTAREARALRATLGDCVSVLRRALRTRS